MDKIFYCILFSFFLFEPFSTPAQTIPVNDKALSRTYSFISSTGNHINDEKNLSAIFQKLQFLKKEGRSTVSIVHIGDSHIQADYFTAITRNGMQQFFGAAGRGLVFPYQLAQSNTPPDIVSTSNTSWEFNRVAHPEIPIAPGISGYCIRTNSSGASIDISLKATNNSAAQTFNRLKFFMDNQSSVSWILQANNNNAPVLIKKEEGDTSVFNEIILDQNADSFSLASLPSDSMKIFYGVSLENNLPGVIYHTIGVNGATYDSYNSASLFWQQLPALKADLYIVSLGTNEAQKAGLDQKIFRQQLETFFQKLKITAPGASILVTTPADYFNKSRRPNPFLKQISNSISLFCNHNKIPIWDMYHITGGIGSAYRWLKKGMMNKDRVHFTNDGYRIQGLFFFNAIAKAYNNFIGTH